MTRATPGIVQITPFIFARDISASAAFYQSIGFLPTHVNPDHKHACCEGPGHALHLLESGTGSKSAPKPSWGNR